MSKSPSASSCLLGIQDLQQSAVHLRLCSSVSCTGAQVMFGLIAGAVSELAAVLLLHTLGCALADVRLRQGMPVMAALAGFRVTPIPERRTKMWT